MDLLIICLGTCKIMLQCITCRVQTSTLKISEKPTIVIIWIFYSMKNASVKGGGEWHLREVWIWWVSRARQNLSISPPHFRQNVFETLNHLISILQYLRNCRHFSCILCTTKIHTMLSLKKI